jgi:single-strand DNA-binding protein
MASVNKVIIMGNLGRDPEMRYMPSGDAIANISVATTYRTKDRNTGEAKDYTEWHRISFFGRLAELVGQYMKKGGTIYVEGRLQTRKYTDKDGIERYATEVVAESMQMVRSGPSGGSDDTGSEGDPPAQRPPVGGGAQRPAQRPAPNFSDMDDDIPF